MTEKKVKPVNKANSGKVPKKRPPVRSQKRFDIADYRVRFFVADDIRVDADGKPMLIGFFPDDIVGLKSSEALNPTVEKPILLPGLAFMFMVSAPPGDHEATIELELGGKKVERKVVVNQFTTTAQKRSFNLVARAQPLPIFGFGKKTVKLIVDGHDFSGHFFVEWLPTT